MEKVFIITIGEYSDIVGCFSTREEAKEFTHKVEGLEEATIKEWDVDALKPPPKGFSTYLVQTDSDGKVKNCYCIGNAWFDYQSALNKRYDFYGENNTVAYVFAKDKKHAEKIMNERRANGEVI